MGLLSWILSFAPGYRYFTTDQMERMPFSETTSDELYEQRTSWEWFGPEEYPRSVVVRPGEVGCDGVRRYAVRKTDA